MKQKVFSSFLILTVVVVFIILFRKLGFDDLKESLYSLNDGWEISLNNKVLSETSIHDVNEKVKAGDSFTLKRSMPDITIPVATLRIYGVHAYIRVFLDDKPIFSFGDEYMENYGFIPQGYSMIPIPAGYEGKTLKLIYTAAEDDAFSGFRIPRFGTLDSLIRFWVDETSVIMFAGVYLLVFGFVTSVIALFTIIFYKQKTKALAGGLLSVNIGVFALAYSDSLYFLTFNLFVTSVIEYVSQISLAVTVFSLAKTLPVHKRAHSFINLCFVCSVASLCAALILQVKQIVPLPTYLIYYQRVAGVATFVLCIIMSTTLAKLLLNHFEKKKILNETDIFKSADFLLYMSLLTLVFFLILELIFYQLMKYVLGNESSYSNIMLVIGIYAFSVLIFLCYLFYDIASIRERNQSDRLEKMAYTDALTGLYNKAFCNNALQKLQKAGTLFSVLMMDVNHLKSINDTFGHDEGDRLLKAFADILCDKFRKTDILCRIGGDEFLVVMAKGSASICQSRIKELTTCLENVNSSNMYPFSISVAMGYALSNEAKEMGTKGVLTLADERMYEIKRDIHSESTY